MISLQLVGKYGRIRLVYRISTVSVSVEEEEIRSERQLWYGGETTTYYVSIYCFWVVCYTSPAPRCRQEARTSAKRQQRKFVFSQRRNYGWWMGVVACRGMTVERKQTRLGFRAFSLAAFPRSFESRDVAKSCSTSWHVETGCVGGR